MQAQSCDYDFCDSRNDVAYGGMEFDPRVKPEVRAIFYKMAEKGMTQRELSKRIAIDPDMMSKVRAGTRKMSSHELVRARRVLGIEGNGEPELPAVDPRMDFVSIDLLPSYAGMGGGGTGDGDQQLVPMPRRLIIDQLRGQPKDFLLLDVRGDSMEPEFHHGDQILIDKRDRDPRQPGPFALWDDDGYVIKLVERVPQKKGWYRIFSSNPRYSSYEIEENETTIMGRPVWFARRL